MVWSRETSPGTSGQYVNRGCDCRRRVSKLSDKLPFQTGASDRTFLNSFRVLWLRNLLFHTLLAQKFAVEAHKQRLAFVPPHDYTYCFGRKSPDNSLRLRRAARLAAPP